MFQRGEPIGDIDGHRAADRVTTSEAQHAERGRALRAPWSAREALVLAAIVVVGAAVRLYGLGRDGLWLDETQTMTFARMTLPDLWRELHHDVQAPLFFVLVGPVVDVLGPSELGVRLLPCLIGVATIPFVYVVARRIGPPQSHAAPICAALLALSPMHIAYSREARGYTLLMLLSCAVLLASWLLDDRPTYPRAVVLGLLLAAMGWSHAIGLPHGAGVVAPFALRALSSTSSQTGRWARLRYWLVAAVVGVIALAPWLHTLSTVMNNVHGAFDWNAARWREDFPTQIVRSWVAMNPSAPPPIRMAVDELPLQSWVGGVACAVLVAAGCRGRFRSRWRSPWSVYLLMGAFLLPLAAIFVSSMIGEPIYTPGRYDSPALPTFTLLVGCSAAALLPARGALLVPVAAAIVAIGPINGAWLDHRSQERSMSRFVREQVQPGDAFVITGLLRLTFVHYLTQWGAQVRFFSYPSDLEIHPSWIDLSSYTDDELARDADKVADAAVVASLAPPAPPAPPGHGRVWLLHQRARHNDFVADALARKARHTMTTDMRYLGFEVRGYEVKRD